MNGLPGLKPTVGLVSRSGIIPISVSQDTAGPMARTVSDVALLLTAMAGVDAADPVRAGGTGKIATDYTTFLKADALKGKRFGVLRQAMGYHPDVDASMTKAIDAIKAAGGEVIDVKVPTYNDWNDPEFAVLLYEFKDGLNAYLKKSGSPHASLEALIAWNKANAKQVMPIFGQEIFEQAQAKGPLTDAAYIKARDTARRLAGKDGLVAALDKEQARRVDRAQPVAGVADRSRAGRSLRRRGLRDGRGGRHAEHHGADRRQPRAAARHHVHGPRVQRRRVDWVWFCDRAGDQGAAAPQYTPTFGAK